MLAENPQLRGKRPIDLLAAGDVEHVLSAARGFVSGAYI
jgi:hypothetical protein